MAYGACLIIKAKDVGNYLMHFQMPLLYHNTLKIHNFKAETQKLNACAVLLRFPCKPQLERVILVNLYKVYAIRLALVWAMQIVMQCI